MDIPIEENDALDWLPALLQTADAGFPTGAYAHSLGFEEIVRAGVVSDEATLGDFLREHLAPALENFELPYLRFAFDAAAAGDFEELCALDAEAGAAKLAREIREASAQLGVRRLKALRVILHAPAPPALETFARRVAAGECAGHHIIVCALQASALGVPLRAALAAYFYQATAAVCAAAPKLFRIGQDGCQRALRAGNAGAAGAVARSLAVAREDAGWFDPLLEIAGMRHERASERLFIS